MKAINKNGNLLSFFQIIFCGEGSGDEMIFAKMSDKAMEIMGSSEKNAKQEDLTADHITAKVDEIGTERSYLSIYICLSFYLTHLFRTWFNRTFTMVRLILI